MTIEHIAIWTNDLERLKSYYTKYFKAVPNQKYINSKRKFASYFLSFKNGARLEIMQMKGVPQNLNDTIHQQHTGLIHFAFGVESIKEVDQKAEELSSAGYKILSGPRITGDGYYEFETLDPDNNRIEITTKALHKKNILQD